MSSSEGAKVAPSIKQTGYAYINERKQYLSSHAYNRARNGKPCKRMVSGVNHAKLFKSFHHDTWPLTNEKIGNFKLTKLFVLNVKCKKRSRPWNGDRYKVDNCSTIYEVINVDLNDKTKGFELTCIVYDNPLG